MRKWIQDTRLTKKLLIAPAATLLFLIVLGVASYIGSCKQGAALDNIFKNRFTLYRAVASTIVELGQINEALTNMVKSAREMDALRKQMQAEKQEAAGSSGAATSSVDQIVVNERRKLLADFKRVSAVLEQAGKQSVREKEEEGPFLGAQKNSAAYASALAGVIENVDSPDFSAAESAFDKARPAFTALKSDLYALLHIEERLSEKQYRSAGVTQKIAVGVMAVVFLIAVFLSVIVSTAMRRIILSPVTGIVEAMEVVAAGDLTKRVEIVSGDEIGEMAKHFNGLADRLHEAITRVAASGREVSSAAGTLDEAAEKMAERVDQAVLQINGVATASEEMSKTAGEIAQNCAAAVKNARSAYDSADMGKAVIEATREVMNRINERVGDTAEIIASLGARSDQIGEIVGLINDVADQTNLLALNAAIEAARAGEHGRGFAVVADEVRKLAERTTSATKEIGETIHAMQAETKKAVSAMEQGVTEVGVGTEKAAKSGEALESIVAEIDRVTEEINQIAVASEEETATTDEIASGIQQISGVMYETAQRIKENSSASSQLAGLAKELKDMVGQFRLAEPVEGRFSLGVQAP